MVTGNLHKALTLFGLGLLLFSMVACQKRCQQAATQAFQHLSETEWRFAESTNPGFKNLDRYNFLIMSFKSDGTGEVFSVVNNKRPTTPARIFKWKADRDANNLQVAYTEPTGEANGGGSSASTGTSAATQSAGAVVTYDYHLGRELNLTEAGAKPYSYRLIPFVGFVEPDDNCTF